MHPAPNYRELSDVVMNTPIVDTHEHLVPEAVFLERSPDVLASVMDYYTICDLVTTRAKLAIKDGPDGTTLFDEPDLWKRFLSFREAWEAMQFTGYGESVRLAFQIVYGIDQINEASLYQAQSIHKNEVLKPGGHLSLLRDQAKLDCVQIDNWSQGVRIDENAPDFYLYDIGVGNYAAGHLPEGVSPADFPDWLDEHFQQESELAVAVKSPHAYSRPLFWEKRELGDVEAAWQRQQSGKSSDPRLDQAIVGDWSLEAAAKACAKYNLPFKIHTGYKNGNGYMTTVGLGAGGLCDLIIAHPETHFVLMHAAYPYTDELIAIAKHHPNVTIDLCWAWSIDPYTCRQMVRKCIHALPTNKLLIFAGDQVYPVLPVGHAAQARHWFYLALSDEITDGTLNEKQAIYVAERYMLRNAYEIFDLDSKKRKLQEQ